MFTSAWMELIQITFWGLASGILSMLLYGRYAPQGRLAELKDIAADVHRRMGDYEGDFSGALALARENLGISFQRLGVAFGPAFLAGAPVIAVLALTLPIYGELRVLAVGPEWVQNWMTWYFAMVAISALAAKKVLHIQ